MQRVDVVVVGAGAMGSAAAWHLARRGRSVALLERFGPAHDRGSSHGRSRIFRHAYADPLYVHLARRALVGWREVEADAGETLVELTGAVDHGDPAEVRSIAAALGGAGVDHEVLTGAAAAERWPGFAFDPEGGALFHPSAGRCRSEAAVAALQRRAVDHGADVRFDTPVTAVVPTADAVEVRTADGAWRAPVAVVATGSWMGSSTGDLPPLEVTEELVLHFPPASPDLEWPSFLHHRDPFVYGLLTPGEGVKVAEHHTGPVVDPDRRLGETDEPTMRRIGAYVERWLPGLVPEPVSATTCLYTTTPSQDFVLDRVGPVVVASACSGHGFKFTPEVGRLAADLADGHPPPEDRFTLAAHRSASPATAHR